jgi:MFS family permease
MVAQSKWASLAVLCLCAVAALALWFSATAVVPALAAEYALSGFSQSLLTSAVQGGFVVGSLLSAALGLADRLDPRRFFMAASVVGALANLAILWVEPTSAWVVVFRFITGASMAGVYPVGMKLASTWARADMGLMVGLLVGAVTLGSAMPHLFNALGGIDWRFTLAAASASALLAAAAINFCGIGPTIQTASRFHPSDILSAWRDKPLRLANLGYLGHMWELFAMWAWIGVFLRASFSLSLAPGDAPAAAKLVAFATIGVGALGCLVGGAFADRMGRTTLTILAMAVSGACALTVGFLYGGSPWLLVVLCLIWGVAVVADSAQFSACVAELCERHLVGTMLTLQTALGFSLTLVTIHLMPLWVEWMGWRYAFAPLAIGPIWGVWAMVRLRARPESLRLARGRR